MLCCMSHAWPLLTRQRWDAPRLLIQLLWTACRACARACCEEHRSIISLPHWLNCCDSDHAFSDQDYVKQLTCQ